MAAAKSTTPAGSKPHRRSPELTFVELEPFREAFRRQQKREGLTVSDVARRAGADRELTARRLGAKKPQRKRNVLANGEVVFYEERLPARIRYEAGVALCRALEVAPVDVGV